MGMHVSILILYVIDLIFPHDQTAVCMFLHPIIDICISF